MKQSTMSRKLKRLKPLVMNLSENSENIFLGRSSDLDLHIFNTNIQNQNAPHILPEELQNQHFLRDDKDENISVLHLNIRSINKNFENFKMFLSNRNFSFSMICFSKTWLNDLNVDKTETLNC